MVRVESRPASGDTILTVDGQPVHHFSPTSADSVTWRIVTSTGAKIALEYVRDGKTCTAEVTPYHRETKWYERKALRQVLIRPAMKSIVYDVASNSPAALAGLKSGDEVVALNGKKFFIRWRFLRCKTPGATARCNRWF